MTLFYRKFFFKAEFTFISLGEFRLKYTEWRTKQDKPKLRYLLKYVTFRMFLPPDMEALSKFWYARTFTNK